MLRYVAWTAGPLVVLSSGLAWGWKGGAGALGALLGGGLVTADFVAILWIVNRLADPGSGGSGGAGLILLALLKFGGVGVLLWYAMVIQRVSGEGVSVGLVAATLGFVAGLVRGQSSPEGIAALEAAERRIAVELESEGVGAVDDQSGAQGPRRE